MNFLAHAWLSFHDPDIMTGNMVSDFVKGKKRFDYPSGIQKGITLHRSIDEFTDNHPATREAKTFFRPVYGLYAAPLVDVVYDYFLANDPDEFPHERDLANFSQEVYGILRSRITILPERFQALFRYMQHQDWLFHYRFSQGIQNSFASLVRRARFMDDPAPAFRILEENHLALQQYARIFFPEVKAFAQRRLEDLNHQ